MSFVVTKNRLPAVIAAFPGKVEAAGGKVAADTLTDAQSRAAVDTGNMRGSGYVKQVARFTWEIGFTAAYTVFVELGTRYMRAQPFIIPAWVAGRYRLMQAMSRIGIFS